MNTHIKARNIRIDGHYNEVMTITVEFIVQQSPKTANDPKNALVQKIWDYFYKFDTEIELENEEPKQD